MHNNEGEEPGIFPTPYDHLYALIKTTQKTIM